MTLKIPDPSIGDRILKCLGKKRGLILPKDINEQHGRYVYAKAIKENFWKALLRLNKERLPENAVDYETFWEQFQEIKGSD